MVNLLMISPRISTMLWFSVNSAFQSTLWSTWTTATTGVGANHNPVAGVTKPVHSSPAHATAATPSIGFASRPPWDPNAMDVNATQRRGPNPVVCYWCGKTGHTRPNCPEAFDVCTITVEECSDFVQCELAAFISKMANEILGFRWFPVVFGFLETRKCETRKLMLSLRNSHRMYTTIQ